MGFVKNKHGYPQLVGNPESFIYGFDGGSIALGHATWEKMTRGKTSTAQLTKESPPAELVKRKRARLEHWNSFRLLSEEQ